jgi:3-dehydroquinate synthase
MSDRLVVRSRLRDYQVRFVGDFVQSLSEEDRSALYIVDEGLLALYRETLGPALPAGRVKTVHATEQHKTLEYCQDLLTALIRDNIRKHSTLIAIGGGIIQDITAFIASILFRGVEWKFYPTTLLAQADSCVGSKSSLNVGAYKNLVGTFYPPAEIFIDVNVLRTLPESAIKSGIGEILHFYLVDGCDGAAALMDRYDDLLRDPRLLEGHIRASLEIKRKMVEIDEFDRDQRNLFNYGHTFGHAVESVSDYRVPHGQAVTLGMDIANYVSLELGHLDKATFLAMHEVLLRNMPDFRLEDPQLDGYLAALARDKKNRDNDLTCILTEGPGRMKKMRLPLDQKLKGIIGSYFRSPIATGAAAVPAEMS